MIMEGLPFPLTPHVAGNGDQDKVGLVRHSQRGRGATDTLHLNRRRHSLTLPLRGIRHPAYAGS
jgi:hypothetical protein